LVLPPFTSTMHLSSCILAALLFLGCASAQRAGRRGQRQRSGRQDTGYNAPPADNGYSAPAGNAQPAYNNDQDVYQGSASSPAGSDSNLAMLEKSVPGVPGEDYPIYAEVPESGFACDGQVDGGYYADPEAECQVFHICTADGQGGLAKYSFLCPNGTIFNQNYFICDWWFNFDCSEAEGLYSLNEDIAAEREAASPAASNNQNSYSAPSSDAGAPIGGYDAPNAVAEIAQAAYGQAARNARNGRGPQQPFSQSSFNRRNNRRG